MIRRGGLGDTLLMLPLLRALRRAHPGAALHFAGVREYAAVFVAHGAVDVARSAEDLELWSGERASRHLAPFSLVIGDEPAVVHVPLEPGRCERGVPFGLQLARQALLEPRWPDDASLVPPHPRRTGPLVLAPGSGGRAKCWSRDHWLSLAARCRGELQVVVGPVELERDDPRAWSWPIAVQFLIGRTPLQLAEDLGAAGVFVGNDSGVTHLAALLGVPTVAVFGPTDPAVWAPVGAHVRVVVGAGCGFPDVDSVAAAVVAARAATDS